MTVERVDRGAFAVFLSIVIVGIIVCLGAFVWRADDPIPPGWSWLGGGVIYRCDGTVGAYRMLAGDTITLLRDDPRCQQ